MTAQFGDTLFYKREKLFLACEPLEDYLESVKLPDELVAPSSACWRGYTAEWVIDNDKLFLTKWNGTIRNYQKVSIDYLFPGEEFVFANWFSGEIRIPRGREVEYIHAGYASIYEGEMILEFKKGVLINEKTVWLTAEEIENIRRRRNEDDSPF